MFAKFIFNLFERQEEKEVRERERMEGESKGGREISHLLIHFPQQLVLDQAEVGSPEVNLGDFSHGCGGP